MLQNLNIKHVSHLITKCFSFISNYDTCYKTHWFYCKTRLALQNAPIITKTGITNSDLHDFVDNNTFTTTCKNLSDLLYILEKEATQNYYYWLNNNYTKAVNIIYINE